MTNDIIDDLLNLYGPGHTNYTCLRAADEIKQLCADLAAARAERDQMVRNTETLLAAAANNQLVLHSDLAAARADAARYRWIRDNHEVRGRAMEIVYGMNGSDWDAAIDAALAGEKRNGL